ncbi:MAG: hypothetical protein CSB06_01315 [Bacteroidia bacterium]|nr:MAG: hypothetical protein CSB06_01315 [Bacteroidia bacterium]
MKNKTRQIYLTIFLLLTLLSLQAQDNTYKSSGILSLKYGKGYIYPHHQCVKYLTKGYTTVTELNWSMRTNGKKAWHYYYKRPVLGLALSYRDLANPEILGKSYAFSPFMQFYLIETRPFSLRLKTAIGVSVLSKKFDIDKNIHNILIGSHANAYIHLNLDIDIRLAPGISAIIGGGVAHYSNGHMKPPNKGVNIFELQSGLRYTFSEKPKPVSPPENKPFRASNELSLQYCGGMKKVRPGKYKDYYTSIIGINFERRITPLHRFGIGINFFSDHSVRNPYISYAMQPPQNYYAGGTHLSYAIVFNQFEIGMQMGMFFYKTHKYSEFIYQRYAIIYRFGKYWMAQTGLKTYWGSADFMFVGLGCRIPL